MSSEDVARLDRVLNQKPLDPLGSEVAEWMWVRDEAFSYLVRSQFSPYADEACGSGPHEACVHAGFTADGAADPKHRH